MTRHMTWAYDTTKSVSTLVIYVLLGILSNRPVWSILKTFLINIKDFLWRIVNILSQTFFSWIFLTASSKFAPRSATLLISPGLKTFKPLLALKSSFYVPVLALYVIMNVLLRIQIEVTNLPFICFSWIHNQLSPFNHSWRGIFNLFYCLQLVLSLDNCRNSLLYAYPAITTLVTLFSWFAIISCLVCSEIVSLVWFFLFTLVLAAIINFLRH